MVVCIKTYKILEVLLKIKSWMYWHVKIKIGGHKFLLVIQKIYEKNWTIFIKLLLKERNQLFTT